jgi:hypothetical protein
MNFGLITEGASEHRIIRHIITRYFKDQQPVINQIQPKIVNEKQETAGGWNEVLKYCGRDEINGALVENDYLVIQIDTDQSSIKPFSISHTDNGGKPKSSAQLHDEVVQKLSSLIKEDIREKYKGRIFFAICIHTIECWLLPVFYVNKHKTDTSNCLSTLNVALGKHDIHIITSANKNKPNGIRSYDAVLKDLKKKGDIEGISQHNIGFHNFINSLKTIK